MKCKKLQMFPLLVDKWIAGTQYLTHQQKGFYLDLILYLFVEQKPIKDDRHVARITGTDIRVARKLWAQVRDKFKTNQHGSTHLLVTNILNNNGRIKGLGGGGNGAANGGGDQAQYKEKDTGTKVPGEKSPDDDPESVIWKTGVGLLKTNGMKESQARSFLGKQVQTHKKPKVASVIAEAVIKKPVDPRAWISGALKNTTAPCSLSTPQDIENAFRQYLGKSSPIGKTVDECRVIFQREYKSSLQ